MSRPAWRYDGVEGERIVSTLPPLVIQAADDFGAAWEWIEGALPEWWYIRSVIRLSPDVWEVVASGDQRIIVARGSSVAAAVRELISRLPAPRVFGDPDAIARAGR